MLPEEESGAVISSSEVGLPTKTALAAARKKRAVCSAALKARASESDGRGGRVLCLAPGYAYWRKVSSVTACGLGPCQTRCRMRAAATGLPLVARQAGGGSGDAAPRRSMRPGVSINSSKSAIDARALDSPDRYSRGLTAVFEYGGQRRRRTHGHSFRVQLLLLPPPLRTPTRTVSWAGRAESIGGRFPLGVECGMSVRKSFVFESRLQFYGGDDIRPVAVIERRWR